MKPIFLKMQAFGPYARCTEIDFAKIKEGVFLITGDTGAGKTSIFDAISYALFGMVSGGKTGKNNKSLRSDFAKEDELSFVEFEFKYRDGIYKIKRVPEQQRLKLRGEGVKNQGAEASMILPDGNVISGVDKVNEKVIEEIGIDQTRFSQIAMIAQGDFRKILTEKSDSRSELFRKIFDTSFYEDFQRVLSEKLTSIDNERKGVVEHITELLSSVEIDENDELYFEADEAKKAVYAPEKMMEVLKKATSTDNKKIVEAEKAIEEAQSVLKDLHLKITTANEINASLTRLEKLQKELFSLMEKAEEIEGKKLKIALAERAREVKGVFDKLEETKKKHVETKKAIEDNAIRAEETERAIVKAKERLKKADESILEIERYKEKATILTNLLPDMKSVKAMAGEISLKEDEYRLKKAESEKASSEYIKLRGRYFDNLAGIIASELKEGERCPVCGSVEHPHMAQMSEEVSREEVEKAEEKASVKAEELGECATKLEKLKGEYKALLTRIEDSGEFDLRNVEEAYEECERKLLEIKTQIEKMEKECNEARDEFNVLVNAKSAIEGEKIVLDRAFAEEEEQIKCYSEKFEVILKEKGFGSQGEFEDSVIEEGKLKKFCDEVGSFEKTLGEKKAAVKEAEIALDGKTRIETGELLEKENEMTLLLQEKNALRDNLKIALDARERIYQALEKEKEKCKKLESAYTVIKELSDTANGKVSGNRITFEAYIQQYYFNLIVEKANVRLASMTGGRYLLETKAQGGTRGKGGLDLEVFDNNTGKKRDVTTLSGGEGFMASLSLALGLSDMIQERNGGIRLDALFIDEGFGTLDATHLDKAVGVLAQLSGNDTMVGIISHVSELKERIDKKIVVRKLADGSSSATVEV